MQPTPTPAPPAPPPIPVAPGPLPGVVDGTPAEIYRATEAQVRELQSQIGRLEERHGELTSRIRETPFSETAIRKGLEGRLAEVDGRLGDMERQLTASQQRLVQYAGAAPPAPLPPGGGPPEEVFIIPVVFIMFVLFPLTVAFARRIWRRTTTAAATIPAELMERIARIETAVDSVAIEVERIGEGQRFVSRLYAEGGGRHLGAGDTTVGEVEAREPVAVPVAPTRAPRRA